MSPRSLTENSPLPLAICAADGLSKGQPCCHNIAFAIIANAIIMDVNNKNKPEFFRHQGDSRWIRSAAISAKRCGG
jgi:hypothetical protein